MHYYLTQPKYIGKLLSRELYESMPENRPPVNYGNELHAFLFSGDTGGAAAFTFFGSLAYNWGSVLLLPAAFVIGGLVQQFTIQYIRGGRTLMRTTLFFSAGMRLEFRPKPSTLPLDGVVQLLLVFLF